MLKTHIRKLFFLLIFFRFLITGALCTAQTEQHRPQFHFSPQKNWMNDPNGLVYYKGEYHLFFQHYPDSTVWGPMHWGHAVSKDLMHWEQMPIALYPDSLGLIFSGSIVVDSLNTSGFKKGDNYPLVAIFTHHNMAKEKKGDVDFQTQSMAYSTDKGITWVKYTGNPVLKNPNLKDFRDPKVFWYALDKKWVMVLAVGNHTEFYGSADLKTWDKTGEFGKNEGAHGGVWECPDLIKMRVEGTYNEKWILIQSIGRGGPNSGGSATQYFVGEFDGRTFKNDNTKAEILWLDYGTDNYAAVSFTNVPSKQPIIVGWMSNWLYATVVPTEKWRSAMTLPRELKLKNTIGGVRLFQKPIQEIKQFRNATKTFSELKVKDTLVLFSDSKLNEIDLSIDLLKSKTSNFSVRVSNRVGEFVDIGFNSESNMFYVDRSKSGKVSFEKSFSDLVLAPRISKSTTLKMHLFLDVASAEIFWDDGITAMTSIYFPNEDFSKGEFIPSDSPFVIESVKVYGLKK